MLHPPTQCGLSGRLCITGRFLLSAFALDPSGKFVQSNGFRKDMDLLLDATGET
jgi:hypothetical protein